jgi:hypothetical protein
MYEGVSDEDDGETGLGLEWDEVDGGKKVDDGRCERMCVTVSVKCQWALC